MKKTVSLVLAIIIAACLASVIVSADVDPEIGINRLVSIYEAETAPIVDGVVTDGEYGEPIGVWLADTIMQSLGDYAKNMPVSIYMCYDADYIYYAVVAKCDFPHVAYDEGEHHAYGAHHLMSMIIPDDPTRMNDDESYVYPDASGYNWGAVWGSGACYEWCSIFDSKKNEAAVYDYFLAMSSENGFRHAAKAAAADGENDVYEVAIPWSAMKSKVQPEALSGVDGTVFGFDCDLGLTDIGDGDDGENGEFRGNYIYFAGAYSAFPAKNLRGCAIVTCSGKKEEPVSEPSSEPVSESASEVSDNPTQPTSDSGIIALAVIASVAAAGAFAVKKSR